ncbi:hypothetical protein BJV78DRAFT_1078528, partial [Lactifluus subvellereus]
DLVPEFEDGHEIFFAAETGYFMWPVEWNPPELNSDRCITEMLQPEELTPSIPSKIRTAILEIAEVRFLLVG